MQSYFWEKQYHLLSALLLHRYLQSIIFIERRLQTNAHSPCPCRQHPHCTVNPNIFQRLPCHRSRTSNVFASCTLIFSKVIALKADFYVSLTTDSPRPLHRSCIVVVIALISRLPSLAVIITNDNPSILKWQKAGRDICYHTSVCMCNPDALSLMPMHVLIRWWITIN